MSQLKISNFPFLFQYNTIYTKKTVKRQDFCALGWKYLKLFWLALKLVLALLPLPVQVADLLPQALDSALQTYFEIGKLAENFRSTTKFIKQLF